MAAPDVTVSIRDDVGATPKGADAEPALSAASGSPPPPAAGGRPRLFYLDWVRALVIALVVAFHTIDLYFDYTASSQYYLGVVYRPPADKTRIVALVAAQLMQSWFMGCMFFVSALFTGPSYRRKGPARFLAERALRLLIPLAAYEFLLQPLAFEIARQSGVGAPPELAAASSGFGYYFRTQYTRLGHGAAWFLVILFIFDSLYVATRLVASCFPRKAASAKPLPASGDASLQEPQQQQQLSLGACLGLLLAIAGLLAALSLIVRLGVIYPLGLPPGMWLITGLQFQPAYLPQYAAAFVLGLCAGHPRALDRLPAAAGWASAAAAAGLGAGGGALMARAPGSDIGPAPAGGRGAPGYLAAFAVWEAFYAVAATAAVLVVFRQRFNARGGVFGAAVAGAAYAAYILHVPILTAFGLAFEAVSWHPAAKCALVTPLAAAAAFGAGAALRCIPGVKRVL